MRIIPTALQAKLDSGVTTLCRCWIVTRRDGVVQGFTDHDEDVVVGERDLPRRHRTQRVGGERAAWPRGAGHRNCPARCRMTR